MHHYETRLIVSSYFYSSVLRVSSRTLYSSSATSFLLTRWVARPVAAGVAPFPRREADREPVLHVARGSPAHCLIAGMCCC